MRPAATRSPRSRFHPVRIGHYTPNVWGRGGVGTYVRRLGRAQSRAGHEVRYFSFAPPPDEYADVCFKVQNHGEVFEQAKRQGLDVLHLHRTVSILPRDRVPTIRTLHGHEAYCPSGSRYLEQWGRPCNRAYSVSGCLWGHLADRCGSRRPKHIRMGFRRTQQEMRILSDLRVHTVSRFLKDQMVRSGYDAEKIHVLHSPAPEVSVPYAPPPQDGTPRFVFLGRIVPQKGLAWLLKALARVESDAQLDVAGEGYIQSNMQQLAARLGIEDRVTFHGWVDRERAAQLVQAARAVVFPSVWHEPAGLVTLEAAAQGRAVIASRVGGIPEYASEEFAQLVPPNDIDALALAMEQLAGDRELVENMGHRGRHIVRDRFAMDHFIDNLNGLYTSILPREPSADYSRTSGELCSVKSDQTFPN